MRRLVRVHIVHNMELLAIINYGFGLRSFDCVSWSATSGALAKREQRDMRLKGNSCVMICTVQHELELCNIFFVVSSIFKRLGTSALDIVSASVD